MSPSPRWAVTAPSPSRALGVNVTNGNDDLVSSKLPALQAYQLSIAAPPPPPGSFDAAAAARGQALFAGAGSARLPQRPAVHRRQQRACIRRATRWASRSPGRRRATPRAAPTKRYRTAPLKGVWQHAPYFHNGTRRDARPRSSRPTTRAARSGSPRSNKPTWSST